MRASSGPEAAGSLLRGRAPGPAASALALASALAASPAQALDDFGVSAAVGVTRDDNVYRLGGASSDGDTYSLARAGLHFDMPVSAQHLVVDGTVEDYRYQHFGDLDHDAYNVEAGWLWALGSRTSGKLDYQTSSVLTSFSNLQAGVQTTVPNEQKSQKARAEAGYGSTGMLQLRGAVDHLVVTNSAEQYQPSDMRNNGAEASLALSGKTGHRIGIEARADDATLPNPEVVVRRLVDNSYQQRRIGPFIEWQLSDRLELKAHASRVRRDFDEVPERNFSAWTWRGDATWRAGEKFSLTAQVRHDISEYEEINVGLVFVRGVALQSVYAFSEKTSLTLNAEHDQRSYHSDAAALNSLPIAEHMNLVEARLSWQATRLLSLGLVGHYESRQARQAVLDYKANVGSVEVRLTF